MNSTVTRPVAVGIALLAAAVGCGSGDDVGPDLSAAPTGVRWQDYQGIALPQSDQGPATVTQGAATGFEHSPRGAGLAALTHTIRLSVAPDNQWATVVNQELVPGPARDEWAINRVQLSITGPAAPEYAPRLLGYKITEYRDEQSRVDVYTEYSDRSRAVNHTTVSWYGGDWRLQLPDPQSTDRPVDAIDELPTDIVTLEAPT
ncbi:hypothetical protein [Nocardia rhizosphaerihabitans]|uniref:DUF8175 domain-containing protein n=1 Tax=Nocardia rhizosphaerihabitans TaxID=1691570 RepID=A0ABQ2K679_9NOCA|nr:hypothetical protein [Nocardia rhizosphaerihabitans]GGN69363.1 hypothetical protein GCM10011610_07510 [Nocardia rhizosphaerihabitans]